MASQTGTHPGGSHRKRSSCEPSSVTDKLFDDLQSQIVSDGGCPPVRHLYGTPVLSTVDTIATHPQNYERLKRDIGPSIDAVSQSETAPVLGNPTVAHTVEECRERIFNTPFDVQRNLERAASLLGVHHSRVRSLTDSGERLLSYMKNLVYGSDGAVVTYMIEQKGGGGQPRECDEHVQTGDGDDDGDEAGVQGGTSTTPMTGCEGQRSASYDLPSPAGNLAAEIDGVMTDGTMSNDLRDALAELGLDGLPDTDHHIVEDEQDPLRGEASNKVMEYLRQDPGLDEDIVQAVQRLGSQGFRQAIRALSQTPRPAVTATRAAPSSTTTVASTVTAASSSAADAKQVERSAAAAKPSAPAERLFGIGGLTDKAGDGKPLLETETKLAVRMLKEELPSLTPDSLPKDYRAIVRSCGAGSHGIQKFSAKITNMEGIHGYKDRHGTARYLISNSAWNELSGGSREDGSAQQPVPVSDPPNSLIHPDPTEDTNDDGDAQSSFGGGGGVGSSEPTCTLPSAAGSEGSESGSESGGGSMGAGVASQSSLGGGDGVGFRSEVGSETRSQPSPMDDADDDGVSSSPSGVCGVASSESPSVIPRAASNVPSEETDSICLPSPASSTCSEETDTHSEGPSRSPISTRKYPEHVTLARFSEGDYVVLQESSKEHKINGLTLIRSGAETKCADAQLTAMMKLCSSYIDSEGDECFLYGETDDVLRKPLLFGDAAKKCAYSSVVRTNPVRGICGGVTMRVVRGNGWLRAEIVLLKSRKPMSGVGTTLIDWVKKILLEERHDGETADIVVMALPTARGFFEKMGFSATPSAEECLREIYSPFCNDSYDDESEVIWNVDWDPKLTVKMVWRVPGGENGSSGSAGSDGSGAVSGGDEGSGACSGAGKANGGNGKGNSGSDGGSGSGGGGPRQTRSASGPSSSTDARDQFIRYGVGYQGPSLRNGRVVIKQSTRGGKLGRGLFVGPGGLKAKRKSDRILYSGEVIDGKEAKAREVRCDGDYVLQLNYGYDRVDGKVFADAISQEPDADGNYTVLPGEEWALDAGPGPIANEDERNANAKFEKDFHDKQCLQPYRYIEPLRDLKEGEEIVVKYNRKGTVGDGEHASCTPSRTMMNEGCVLLKDVITTDLFRANDIEALDQMGSQVWASIADQKNGNRAPKHSGGRQMLKLADVQSERDLHSRLQTAFKTIVGRLQCDGLLGDEKAKDANSNTHKAEFDEARLLRTKVGAKWQSYVHGDRAREHAMQAGGFRKMHYSVMVALMADTYLWIKPIGSKKLTKKHIPKGSALAWRGDVGHGGDAHPGGCTHGHYRFFLHVDAIEGHQVETEKGNEVLFPIAYDGSE